MGSSGTTPDVTREDIWSFFSRTEQSSLPYTAAEVAEELETTSRTAQQYLEELTATSKLQSKQLPDATQIWWSPGSPSPDQQSQHEAFAAFVNAVEDYAIFVLDPDGVVSSWNEGAARIKGYDADEIIGEHVSTFYTDDDIDEDVPQQNLETATDTGHVEDEGWRVRDDGSRF